MSISTTTDAGSAPEPGDVAELIRPGQQIVVPLANSEPTAIAHPDHRDELARAATKIGYL